MEIAMMVAVAANRVIGKDNDIPWRGRLKGEQLLFKKYTAGKTVIMGRNTWESIPEKYRPLKGRFNIILTRKEEYQDMDNGVATFTSLKDALLFTAFSGHGQDGVVLMGGSRIYEEGMEFCDTLYLTEVAGIFPGDTFFPEFDRKEWDTEHEEFFPMKKGQDMDYTFRILRKRDD